MTYITVNRSQRNFQITFDDIFNGVDSRKLQPQKDTFDTQTWCVREVSSETIHKTDFASMKSAIAGFNEKYKHLIDTPNKSSLYRSFKIPKKSGGFRQIDAPNDELMSALRELKYILESKFYATYSTNAFAYIRGRSSVDAVERHKNNGSRWFLKLDFSKFFPSTTHDFLMRMLCMTYPISEYAKTEENLDGLKRALSLCFLNGGLPQGTPVSPMLTNMMMIPIDYAIAKMCRESTPHLCYTRYADDMHISSEFDFRWTSVVNNIRRILSEFGAPFALNTEKTHYGNSNGRNWMLGLMLNQNGDITVGYKKKKILKAKIFQFMSDYTKGDPWRIDETQKFAGVLSYCKMVEPAFINHVMDAYSKKFGINVWNTIISVISC